MGRSGTYSALYYHVGALCGYLAEGNHYFWKAVSTGCRYTDCFSGIHQYGSFRGAATHNRTKPTVLHHWRYLYLDDLYSAGDCALGQREDRGQWSVNGAKDFKDLIVWQRAMELVVEVYQLVKKLPKEELFALSDQIRRAVISIPSNIAEGQGRSSLKEFLYFLSIAKGSKAELETQLLLCVKINYLKSQRYKKRCTW